MSPTPGWGPNEDTAIPSADLSLSALAVLEQYAAGDYEAVEGLIASMDHSDLHVGLLALAKLFFSKFASATGTTESAVLGYTRQALLELVSSGELRG